MSINVFEEILIERIEKFKLSFSETSKKVFFNEQGKLIHPAEFGMFRETECRDFLRLIVPTRLDIGQGFLINTFNNISHQCDIVIYDSKNSPLIESNERQRFFPIETVVAVGEVKSILSKSNLSDALNKLSQVKVLREEIKNPAIIKTEQTGKYDPKNYIYDQIFTFLICQKLDFNLENIANEIGTLYNQVEYRHRHNLILSIEDGLLAYYDDLSKTFMYPYCNLALKNRFVQPGTNNYSHFKIFSSYIFLGTSSGTILYPEITDYMGNITGGQKLDEK